MIFCSRIFFVLFASLAFSISMGQGLYRKALFLGNSYTYVNDLPGLTAALAKSSGDSLFFDSNTPGGYTLGWQPIVQAADSVVFGFVSEWNLWNDLPVAAFTTQVIMDTMHTDNTSTHASRWLWHFGDDGTSTEFEPTHVYHHTGTFTVSLKACDSCRCDSSSTQVTISSLGCNNLYNWKDPIRLVCPTQGDSYWFMGFTGDGEIELFDMIGKIIFRGPVHSGRFTMIPIPTGTYLWQLNDPTGQKLYSGKILI